MKTASRRWGVEEIPKITQINFKEDRDRYWVFIDGEFCTSIRGRTFPALGLEVGREVTCEELKAMESFHWKRQYGPQSWKREQVRLERAQQVIEMVSPQLRTEIVGFGAGSDELIEEHPEESGSPDIDVHINQELLMKVEVTGTEYRRGIDYWVRPDKLRYAQKHPEIEVWIMLVYHLPKEHIVVIRPERGKRYEVETKTIRGSDELYTVFKRNSPEVVSLATFQAHLLDSVGR